VVSSAKPLSTFSHQQIIYDIRTSKEALWHRRLWRRRSRTAARRIKPDLRADEEEGWLFRLSYLSVLSGCVGGVDDDSR